MAKRARPLPAVGEVFTVPYPFSRDTYEAIDEDSEGISFTTTPTWKVGPKSEQVQPDDVESVADALGQCVLTVVSVHQPGKYPARVFFTRTWVSPDGKPFGKTKLRIAVASRFRELASGYQHEYRLRGCKCDGCEWPTSDHRQRGRFAPPMDEPESVDARLTTVAQGTA